MEKSTFLGKAIGMAFVVLSLVICGIGSFSTADGAGLFLAGIAFLGLAIYFGYCDYKFISENKDMLIDNNISSKHTTHYNDSIDEITKNDNKEIITLISHFQKMYAKYGMYFSDTEMANIISKYAMASSKSEEVATLMSFIPKTIKSTDFFNDELQKHIDSIIKKFVCAKIVNELKLALLSPPEYLDENDIKVAIESQKGLCPPSSLAYFRYNYELTACILVLSQLDEVSPLFREEAEESAEKLLDYAKESGYLPSDKESV